MCLCFVLFKLKQSHNEEREHALVMLQLKHDQNRKSEFQHQREQLNKEQEQYMRQLRRQQEEQLKQVKEQMNADREEAIKVALELQNKSLLHDMPASNNNNNNSYSHTGSNSAIIVKLQREIISLRDEKRNLEEHYRLKCISDVEKTEEIEKWKKEFEDYKTNVERDLHNDMAQFSLSGADHDLHIFTPSVADTVEQALCCDSSSVGGEHLQRSTDIDGTEADVSVQHIEQASYGERIVEGHDEEHLQTSILETSEQNGRVSAIIVY